MTGMRAGRCFAAAGGEDVREPAPVCLCCRGVCGGRALGAAAASLRSRIKRQGAAGQAFFCLDNRSPAASGGEGRRCPIRSGMTVISREW